ncbi:MAG: ChbG/HpnK family deacetylase [Verrucomicrobia bacterium]|nr:ChbG/HpnK family deacetylase [Verrucomicrobiota bacterium]
MGSVDRRLIVNADDFGRSHAINRAVIRAHGEGILTTASLMVNGSAAAEAVELARQNPRLGVGLHLTLVCGRSALPRNEIPDLVDSSGHFRETPVKTGAAYFFQRRLRPQLQRELEAQFQRFHETGLVLDHVNGHLNLHLHPTVFALLMQNAKLWRLSAVRLTRDPLWLNARIARGRWIYRISHWLVFLILSWRAASSLRKKNIRYTRAVFGLLQNGQVDEEYLLKLLPRLPAGVSELYSHPSLDEFRTELDALISPRVRSLVQARSVRLIRHQDL